MTNENFQKKIALFSSLLILNNYLLLTINTSQILVKINFILFLVIVLFYYFKDFFEDLYFKIFFLSIIFIALGTPAFEWDARSIWLFHAKRIFYENSIFYVADNYAKFSHNDYPTLAPAFASSFGTLVGHWNEVFPKISFTLMYFPPLVLTHIFLKDTKYLIFLSIVFFIIGKFLLNGWMDGLIAVYFSLSTLMMYLFFIDEKYSHENKNFFYYIALCFFISLTMLKNEGAVLLTILFCTSFLLSVFKKNYLKNDIKFFLALLSFLPIILWKYFCYSKGLGSDYINTDTLTNLFSRIDSFENYKLIFYFLLLNEKFLFSLLFFLISFWINRDNKLFIFICTISVSYILVLFFIYLSTPYDFYFQLNSSAARLIKSISLLMAFFGLYNLSRHKILR